MKARIVENEKDQIPDQWEREAESIEQRIKSLEKYIDGERQHAKYLREMADRRRRLTERGVT